MDVPIQRFHESGGYSRNDRGAIRYTEKMDLIDGQRGFLNSLKKTYMRTTSNDDYAYRPIFPGGRHLTGNTFLCGSGWTRDKALHTLHPIGILASVTKAKIIATYDPYTGIRPDCSLTPNTATETWERFPAYPYQRYTGEPFIGSHDSAHTHEKVEYNPVKHQLMDPGFDYPRPFPKTVIASTYKTAFRAPRVLLSGFEGISVTGYKPKNPTGYTLNKELKPTHLPLSSYYGARNHAWNDPSRFITTYKSVYNNDGRPCDTEGKRLVGKGKGSSLTEVVAGNISLDYGHGSPYKTETIESFTTPWPLPGSRNLWTGRPIKKTASSGYLNANTHQVAPKEKCEKI